MEDDSDLVKRFKQAQAGFDGLTSDSSSSVVRELTASGPKDGRTGLGVVVDVIGFQNMRYTTILPFVSDLDKEEIENEYIKVKTYRVVSARATSEWLMPDPDSNGTVHVPFNTVISIKEMTGFGNPDTLVPGNVVRFRALRYNLTRYNEKKTSDDATPGKKNGFDFLATLFFYAPNGSDLLGKYSDRFTRLFDSRVLEHDLAPQIKALCGTVHELPAKLPVLKYAITFPLEPRHVTEARMSDPTTSFIVGNLERIDPNSGYLFVEKVDKKEDVPMRALMGPRGDGARVSPIFMQVTEKKEKDFRVFVVAVTLYPDGLEHLQTADPDQWNLFGPTLIENVHGVFVGVAKTEIHDASAEMGGAEADHIADPNVIVARGKLKVDMGETVKRCGIPVPAAEFRTIVKAYTKIVQKRKGNEVEYIPTEEIGAWACQKYLFTGQREKMTPPYDTVSYPSEHTCNIAMLPSSTERSNIGPLIAEVEAGNATLYMVSPHREVDGERLNVAEISAIEDYRERVARYHDEKFYPNIRKNEDTDMYPTMYYVVCKRPVVSLLGRPRTR